MFACTGFARTPDESDPRSLSLSFYRGRVGEARGFSHLEMHYSTTPLDWEYGGETEDGGAGAAEAPEPPDDIDVPEDESTVFADWPPVDPLDVADGSRLALQMPATGCSATTPLAVLEVTGDPESALAAYGDQFEAITGSGQETTEVRQVPDGRLLETAAFEAGGVSYNAVLYERDGEGSDWLLIDSCYD